MTGQPLKTSSGCNSGVLPGPNLCSQVGENVSTLLQTALAEMCQHRNGSLTREEIDHVFDLVLNSKELFSIYQHAYGKCVDLKDSPQFATVDEDVVMNFVTGAFCRDIIGKTFGERNSNACPGWRKALIKDLAGYLSNTVDPIAKQRLYGAYQKVATLFSGSLTPVTLLNAADVVRAFAMTIAALEETAEPEAAARISEILNRTAAAPRTGEGGVSEASARDFLKSLLSPSNENPFRTLVLNARIAP